MSKEKQLQALEQIRRAIQFSISALSDEQAMEIATVYPKYETGKNYKAGDYFTEGVNSVGDPQLYKVVQDHTSQADWIPSNLPSLYTPIGLNKKGYPTYSKPSGAHDAYNIGDVVDYNGILYESLINGNVYSPDEYAAGWKVYEE